MEQIGISESNRGWEICGSQKILLAESILYYIASHLSENKAVWLEVEGCEGRVQ